MSVNDGFDASEAHPLRDSADSTAFGRANSLASKRRFGRTFPVRLWGSVFQTDTREAGFASERIFFHCVGQIMGSSVLASAESDLDISLRFHEVRRGHE